MAYRPEWDAPTGRGRFWGGRWSATKTLLVSFVVVFVLTLLGESLGRSLGYNPVSKLLTLRIDNFFWLYPFLSYAFVHDIHDPWHLIFNSLVIYFFGHDLEASLGRRRFLGLFFGAVITGAALHLIAQALLYGSAMVSLLGASGGALGLLFYMAWADPSRTVIFWFIPLKIRTLAYIFLAVNIYPILVAHGLATGVAHFCHLGGALYGYLAWRFALDPLSWLRTARREWSRRSDERRREVTREDDAEMDRILKKISEEGLPSLTKSERRFLDERSKSLRRGGR